MTNVNGARDETAFLRNSMESAFNASKEFITSVLSWIDRCLEQNNVDAENATRFSKALEKLKWDTEKELERRKGYCNQLQKAKSDAYDRYQRAKNAQKKDSPSSVIAAERAWDAYREAEKDYERACEEAEACQRRLDAIVKAQYDLGGISIEIHNDRMRLLDTQEEYQRLLRDLESAYQKFSAKTANALTKLGYVSEDVKKAQTHANKAVKYIEELNGVSVSSSQTVMFNSIAAVYRASERIDLHNESLVRSEKEIKRTIDKYVQDIRDSIMPKAEALMGDIARVMMKQIKEKERKSYLMKDVAKELQNYYNVYK